MKRYLAHEKWAESVEVGDFVEDCRYRTMKVVEKKDARDDFYVTFEDGTGCSLIHCCCPVPTERNEQ